MASENRVNLIEEFESQEENDFIVLTTFSFNPAFFDTYLLDKIQRQNPYAEIFVLVDSTTFHSQYDEFTSHTGTSYHILPVEIQNGFFHPKVSLFLSEEDRKADLYVSSANLTLQGFTNNIESVVKLDYDLDDGVPETVEDAIGFFERISESVARDSEFQQYIQDIRESRLLEAERVEEEDAEFLSNHEEPIIDQLVREIDGGEFDEVVLSAPFVSDNPDILSRISDVAELDEVALVLQRDNHNLDSMEQLRDFCNSEGLSFELRELVSERDRFLHAKMILLEGSESYALVGSPNLTKSALLEAWDAGNSECCTLLKNSGFGLLDEFEMDVVEDEEDFLSDRIMDSRERSGQILRIHSVEFLEVANELVLKTERREGMGKVTIYTKDPERMVTRDIDLSQEESRFHLDEGVPKEVEIFHDGDIGRRRVFFDEDIFQKRARRTSASLQEISDSLDRKPDLRLDELVVVFRNLGLSVQEQDEEEDDDGGSSDSGSTSREGGFLPPSRGSGGSSGIDSLLRKLTDVYDTVRSKRERERDMETTYQGEGDEQYITGEESSAAEILEQEQVDKRMKKFLRKSNNLLLEVSERSENPVESWLDAQHFLLMNFLMFFGVMDFSEEVFEKLEELLEDNLENFEDIEKIKDEFGEDVKKRFFT
ncbi:MAG: hypothetical protein ABEJ72_10845, partial [Candidatus Aenigmatarchaeota archaeon]